MKSQICLLITRMLHSRRSHAVTLARVRARSSEDELDAWGPLVNVKRDGVGGDACGQQAVVVDGWPVRDDVAAAAYAASSLLASAASKSGGAQVEGKKIAVLRARVPGPGDRTTSRVVRLKSLISPAGR